MSRYSNIDFILQMDLRDGMNLYLKGKEQKKEDRLYQEWVSLRPRFTKETYVSWDGFKDIYDPVEKALPKENNKTPIKSREQLLAEAKAIRAKIEGRG